MKKGLNCLVLAGFLIALQIVFVSADITVSPTSATANINEVKSFSVIVSNTYTDGIAPNNATVTQVVFTLPSGLLFVGGTNSSNPSSDFSNTSNALTWTNSTYVVNLNSQTTFSFSANATSLGNSSITITSTFANSSTNAKSISLTVATPADATNPVVTLISPENNNEDADGVLVFVCNATDNVALKSIKLAIYSNGSETYGNSISTNGTSNQSSWDYTFNSNGEYRWNCFANDTAGNSAWASNRTIKISSLSLSANQTSACAANWTCISWSVCSNGTQTRTCADSNNCANATGKPSETQTCVPPCTPSWKCADWTPEKCPKDGKQTRTCADSNACGDSTGKPSESLTCEYKSSIGIFIGAGIILLVIAGGIGAFFYLRRNKVDELYPQSGENANQNYPQNQGYNFEYS